MEELTFLQSATLRILGQLSIKEAMVSCLRFLQSSMPADWLFLEQYEPGQGVRTIATATAFRGERVDLLTPLSKEVIADRDVEQERRRAVIIDEPEHHSLAPVMHKLHAIEAESTSVLYLPLWLRDRRLGSVVLVALGRKRFTDDQARLLTLLNEPFSIAMQNSLEHQQALEAKGSLERHVCQLKSELSRSEGELIGAEFGLAPVLEQVRQLAALDCPVLLLGERGTGKSIIASRIHQLSARRQQPFLVLNPGRLPPSALESELFVPSPDVETEASLVGPKRGKLQQAAGGTLLIEELAAVTPELQSRLMPFLTRIGKGCTTTSDPEAELDVRLVLATRHQPKHLLAQGQLNPELWGHLEHVAINVPPLRQRQGDLAALIHHLVAVKGRELNMPEPPLLTSRDLSVVSSYAWPGNVRELSNVVERALLLCDGGDTLELYRLVPREPNELSLNLDRAMAQHIERTLRLTGGKIHGPGGAAERLEINPNTLRSRMRKLGISSQRFGTT